MPNKCPNNEVKSIRLRQKQVEENKRRRDLYHFNSC